ncbi:MAG: 4Fe-4S binding protein [Candidatus Dadabacteria bacterium]|nr:4Fe-4S binding protein [Candidatus Dadabacteria bacterium]NIQ14731.1 4Fe-4S binding protein [Candidatus Dadabacteria bacterium]
MIDAKVLEYSFDEENILFERPHEQNTSNLSLSEKISLAVLGFGILMFVLQVLGASFGGTWMGFLLAFVPIVIGTSVYFWISYKETMPGIKNNNIYFNSLSAKGVFGWTAGIVITGFYILLYFWPQYLEGGIRSVDPLSIWLSGQPANQWFFYGFLYTIAVLVFGVRMFMKYRHDRYQIVRTSSVIFFQLGLAFIIPNLLMLLNQPEFYFSYFWPLKYDYLFPDTFNYFVSHPEGLGVFLIFWGVLMSFIATPVLTYYFGKRWYCSWVCGCGGLAETLGDPWRQLSDKSKRAWRIERVLIHLVLVFVVITTVLLWANSASGGQIFGSASMALKKWYGFYIGAIFSGVIGVGFYPVMGSRVWCRFGCPMAAILGFFQKYFSRFRITTNGGQCISCGNCSTYCEMGIDVRAYAQEGKNIIRSSCVGCGVCSAVCPRGVLKLENGSTYKDRYEGSDKPISAFLESIKHI